MTALFAPSAEAQAFIADPANKVAWHYKAEELPGIRAEMQGKAETEASRIAARHDVALEWQEISGVRCLIVTPRQWDGSDRSLYLFGGAFLKGSPLEELTIVAALAKESEMQFVLPDYALAPEAPFPQGLNDAIAVARAIRPAVVSGESAGGNLALSVTRTLLTDETPPRALALLSPAADLSPGFDPYSAPDDPTLFPPLVELIRTIYAPDAEPYDPRVSPLYGTFGADWPPCLITTGTSDLFLPLCARLARAIRAGGARADLRVWDGMWHVFEYYEGIPEAEASLSEIAAFLAEARDA